jgi:hypothetical protein
VGAGGGYMIEITPCHCGAMPVVEKKILPMEYGWEMPVEKWRCPNCPEKELPFLDARKNYPKALWEWNRIAPKRSYHRRTLAYNESGVCVDEPFKVFEWRDKKKAYWQITIKFYLDNGMYYYCYDYWYGNGGSGKALWIGDPCFPSMEIAKKHAMRHLVKSDRQIKGIVKALLFTPVQGELF